MTGTIEAVRYHKGFFFPAYAEKASLENEQSGALIKTAGGHKIVFVQIAGWLARRIVSRLKPGQEWKRGDIFGLIRFGSRMDVYLPLDWEILVKKGDKTVAGETILARVREVS